MALRIVCRVADCCVKRIVFTGGDPLIRPEIRLLILFAYDLGLEVSVAKLGRDFPESVGRCLDSLSLPLDGSCQAVTCRTGGRGHFADVSEALACLRAHPDIGVTVCTVVTRHNIGDVPRILRLVEGYAEATDARVSCEVYQAVPRAMFLAPWRELLVGGEEYAALHGRIWPDPSVATEFLDHRALDRPRVTIFPDGRLVILRDQRYNACGRFLEVADVGECRERSRVSAGRGRAKTDNRIREQRH